MSSNSLSPSTSTKINSRWENIGTYAVMDMISSGRIIFDPPYDPGQVYTAEAEEQQKGVVQTVLEGSYLPPVVVAQYQERRTGREKWICLDGRKRLISLYRFYVGLITFLNPRTGDFERLVGFSSNNHLDRGFFGSTLLCAIYPNITKDQQVFVMRAAQHNTELSFD